MLSVSAHTDTFTRDNLPPRDQWPDFLLDGFEYPERLNVGVVLMRVPQNDLAGIILRSHDMNAEPIEFWRLGGDAFLKRLQARANFKIAIVP